MFKNTIVAFLLLCSSAFAAITVTDSVGNKVTDNKFNANKLVVLTCDLPTDENTHVIYDWKIDDAVDYVTVDGNKTVYGVGEPGKHNVECTAVLKYRRLVTILVRDPSDPNDISKAKMEDIYVIDKVDVQILKTSFFVEGLTPTPVPDPDPTPDPTPTPTPDPTPTEPDIVPEQGFYVAIIEETADRVLLPKDLLVALESSLPKTTVQLLGGKFFQTDDDTNMEFSDGVWKNIMNRPRKSVPWIVISNDKKWYEGPLPDSLPKLIDLINSYKVK